MEPAAQRTERLPIIFQTGNWDNHTPRKTGDFHVPVVAASAEYAAAASARKASRQNVSTCEVLMVTVADR